MKQLSIALAIFIATMAGANTPPEITNVRASQRAETKLVDIYYDAVDADGDALKIRIEISDNDGVKYSVPAFTLTGDIGEGVTPGTNKHIVWDAGKDWDGEYSDKMRVKVYAIDAQGFPGMEWGNEVPPGGFLLGQDGGAEGSGPSRHVNIPWSYWLGKYEVTVQQYCDFLNAALVSGYVQRNGTTEVRIGRGILPGVNGSESYLLIPLGDDQRIRWNVNNFEVVGAYTNHPVVVTWPGALAFCRYYGYDLPTEAEWEKAARGPDHDDQDEHLLYPWGNTIDPSCAWYDWGTKPVGTYNGNQTPIGADMVNGYGLYDVIGNVAEWTRSAYDSALPIEQYDVMESLDSNRNLMTDLYVKKVVKGLKSYGVYYRMYNDWINSLSAGWSDCLTGFRVARRSVKDISQARSVGKIDFEEVGDSFTSLAYGFGQFAIESGNISVVNGGTVDNTNRVMKVSGSTVKLSITNLQGKLRYVRFRVKGYELSNYTYVNLVSVFSDGTTKWDRTSGKGGDTWATVSLITYEGAVSYYLQLYNNSSYSLQLDDLEFFTTPE